MWKVPLGDVMNSLGSRRQRLGRWGEDLAADHVVAAGCQILSRNCRTRFGEADIVARDGDETVLIEVKTRTQSRFGNASEAVDQRKRSRMRRLAEYLGLSDCRLRFDVIAVDLDRGRAEITWLRGAF